MKNDNVVQCSHYETFSVGTIEQIQYQISKAVLGELNRQVKCN